MMENVINDALSYILSGFSHWFSNLVAGGSVNFRDPESPAIVPPRTTTYRRIR